MGSGRELGAHAPQFRRSKKIYLRFRIPYYTQWGQSLAISGSGAALGNWNVAQSQRMTPQHEGDSLVWEVMIAVPDNFETQYKYCLVDDKLNLIKWEAGSRRFLSIPQAIEAEATVDVHDSWQDGSSPDVLLNRNAFRKVIFGKGNDHEGKEIILETSPFATEFDVEESVAVRFRVTCSRLESGQSVCVTGSASSLGRWVNETAIPLHRVGGSLLQADVIIGRHELPLKYRYIIRNRAGDVISEMGGDRTLSSEPSAERISALIIVSDGYFRARPWKGSGVAVPVFSLRSTEDVGCGEFLDLKLFIDLAVTCGIRLVQLLPINDTSVNMMWWDSYPYSSLSVFALHPIYLRLQALSKKLPNDIKEEIEDLRRRLDLKEVDYEATLEAKLTVARKVFELERDEVLKSPSFQQYFDENQGWLRPYAAFCFLRNLFGTSDHSQWGRYSVFTSEKLGRLVSPTSDHYTAIAFSYYLQYHLHIQMTEVAEYARLNRVVLKGDLPIGVDRNSVDTWVAPTLFRMTASTGAPPDFFDKQGQNWGFPTYNWEEMAKDNYAWWRARLSQMAKYFSAYRIDHILGFFRIWELPDHAVIGLTGRFRPSIPISAEELEQEGIWDFNRLSEPYVRCHLLIEKFGDRWTEVANKYFDETQHLCYQFKEEYNTEKKIAAALKLREGSPQWLMNEAEETQKRLFQFLREVVLLRDTENPRMFYPRFGMDETASFRELDDRSKDVLRNKYEDYFYHRQEKLWRENAMKTLPVLMNSSDMLACGEDLGMVPACVAPVLEELGLLGLRIQRMPNSNKEFGIPSEYEYMTVCAASCHDCSTLREWWEEDEERRARYFKDVLGFSGTPPPNCDVQITHTILQQHVESPSVWAIFPIQDFLALKEEYTKRPATEERINDPSNSKHYWRFRLHVTIEKILHDQELIMIIREMNVKSGRATLTELPEVLAAEYADMSNGERTHKTKNIAYGNANGNIADSCRAPENLKSIVKGGEIRDHYTILECK
ncbi:hypothetical protein R1flu_015073 [Riccia fluitans]|uniref:4-alpha-glucanotransferase n=1 Tax=Riccia fluitans TaxID=41844 RepID=A0ABD1YL20_9MARC